MQFILFNSCVISVNLSIAENSFCTLDCNPKSTLLFTIYLLALGILRLDIRRGWTQGPQALIIAEFVPQSTQFQALCSRNLDTYLKDEIKYLGWQQQKSLLKHFQMIIRHFTNSTDARLTINITKRLKYNNLLASEIYMSAQYIINLLINKTLHPRAYVICYPSIVNYNCSYKLNQSWINTGRFYQIRP